MKRFRGAAARYGILLVTLCVFVPRSLVADTGKDSYQSRCAQCHGKNGEGKNGMKVPSLTSAKAKSMSDDELKKMISQRANGEMEKKFSHRLLKKRLSTDQVDAIVVYIRGMQSK